MNVLPSVPDVDVQISAHHVGDAVIRLVQGVLTVTVAQVYVRNLRTAVRESMECRGGFQYYWVYLH